jgi:hypothetical protein
MMIEERALMSEERIPLRLEPARFPLGRISLSEGRTLLLPEGCVPLRQKCSPLR